MKRLTATILLLPLLLSGCAHANGVGVAPDLRTSPAVAPQAKQPNIEGRRLSPDDVRRVAPALEQYT